MKAEIDPINAGSGGIIDTDNLAQIVVQGRRQQRFHILRHTKVENYVRRKYDDIDGEPAGMCRRHKRSVKG